MSTSQPITGPARAEEQRSDLDEVIHRISHDLRASVRALQELPFWIVEDLKAQSIRLPTDSERQLDLICSHARRLDLMLSGLLEYSRVGRMQSVAAVDPSEILEEVIDDLGYSAPGGPEITRDVSPLPIRIGETDLHRLFAIVLTNAVRFHPDQSPHIRITGGPVEPDVWQVDITDDGPGIPEPMRQMVFRPMTKLVSRDVDEGAGMGLAILKKIAGVYGGSVSIHTPEGGRGITLRIRLAVL